MNAGIIIQAEACSTIGILQQTHECAAAATHEQIFKSRVKIELSTDNKTGICLCEQRYSKPRW